MPRLTFTVLLLLCSRVATADQERHKHCQSYATESVRSAEESERRRCDFQGPRYTKDWQAHYDWCLGAAESAILTEVRIRAEDLARCIDETSAAPFRVFRVSATTSLYPRDERTSVRKVIDNAGLMTFEWRNADPTVEQIIWQVLAQPLPSDDLSLRPAALLGLGQSPAQPNAEDRGGSFAIRPFAYFDYQGTLEKRRIQPLDFEKAVLLNPALITAVAKKADAEPAEKKNSGAPKGGSMKVDAATLMKVGQFANAADPAIVEGVEPGGRQRIYVRAIPRHRDGSLGPAASKLFRISMPPPESPHYRPYRVTNLQLDPGYEASDRYQNCLRVIDYRPPPPGEEWRLTFALAAYPATGTYCKEMHFPPQSSSCEWYECVGDFIINDVTGVIGDAYDTLKTAIDDVKGLALDLSAQFNPFCLQAGLVSEDAEDVCQSIVRTSSAIAVDMYLAANGVPPTLPSTADLLAAAEGDVATLAVGLLEQVGIPCDAMTLSESEAWVAKSGAQAAGASIDIDTEGGVDVCRDLIEVAINEVKNGLADAVSRQTMSVTAMPYYPEVITIPEPMARPAPVQVTFGVERTGVPLDPDHICTARVRVRGKPQGVRIGENVTNFPYASEEVQLRSGTPSHLRVAKRSDTPFARTVKRTVMALNAQKFTVTLDEPKQLPYLPRDDWMAARRAKGLFEPSGYSHILIGGNTLWASVESDCLPDTPLKPATLKYARFVPNRKHLRSQGKGPQWLPAFHDRLCQEKTQRLIIPNLEIDLGIDVPVEPAFFCRFWSNYLAGGI